MFPILITPDRLQVLVRILDGASLTREDMYTAAQMRDEFRKMLTTVKATNHDLELDQPLRTRWPGD